MIPKPISPTTPKSTMAFLKENKIDLVDYTYKEFKEIKNKIKIKIPENLKESMKNKKITNNIELAYAFSQYMRTLRMTNGKENNETLSRIIILFRPLKKIEDMVRLNENSRYHSQEHQINRLINKYGHIIEDFVGWVDGFVYEKEDEDEDNVHF